MGFWSRSTNKGNNRTDGQVISENIGSKWIKFENDQIHSFIIAAELTTEKTSET
jgi:hypothetical protein